MVVSGIVGNHIVVFQPQESLFYAKSLLYLKMSHIEKTQRPMSNVYDATIWQLTYVLSLENFQSKFSITIRFKNKIPQQGTEKIFSRSRTVLIISYRIEGLGFCNVK